MKKNYENILKPCGSILRGNVPLNHPDLKLKPKLTIHGYDLKPYNKTDGLVCFGCAEISVELLKRLRNTSNVKGGNRKVASVSLDSGKVLTIEQINEILNYIKE